MHSQSSAVYTVPLHYCNSSTILVIFGNSVILVILQPKFETKSTWPVSCLGDKRLNPTFLSNGDFSEVSQKSFSCSLIYELGKDFPCVFMISVTTLSYCSA